MIRLLRSEEPRAHLRGRDDGRVPATATKFRFARPRPVFLVVAASGFVSALITIRIVFACWEAFQ